MANSLPEQTDPSDAVVPLPVINANKQYYQNNMNILDLYEGISADIVKKGAHPKESKLHVGGD